MRALNEPRIEAMCTEDTGEVYVLLDVPITVTASQAHELANQLRIAADVALAVEASQASRSQRGARLSRLSTHASWHLGVLAYTAFAGGLAYSAVA
jgi:hypothetical protein